jgi:hypothetical protein
LHHHFQFLGWPENKIVVRFWIASALCALLAAASLKLGAPDGGQREIVNLSEKYVDRESPKGEGGREKGETKVGDDWSSRHSSLCVPSVAAHSPVTLLPSSLSLRPSDHRER